MKMDFGVRLGKTLPFDEMIYQVQSAEEQGFTHTNVGDLPWLNRDPHVLLSVMAMNTNKIKIGQAVTYSTIYHPVVMANITATLDLLSDGRMYLGLGAGMRLGKTLNPQPLSDVRKTIEFFKKYTAGEEAEWEGNKMKSGWINRKYPFIWQARAPKCLSWQGNLRMG